MKHAQSRTVCDDEEEEEDYSKGEEVDVGPKWSVLSERLYVECVIFRF